MSTTIRNSDGRITKWTYFCDGHGAYSIETDDCDGVQICYVRKEKHARLIAAAPELLEAATWAEVMLRPATSSGYFKGHPEFAGYDALLAAIAKATGEQP